MSQNKKLVIYFSTHYTFLMNEISRSAFNLELAKLASQDLEKLAGPNYNLKVPKKLVGKLGWTGLGVIGGAAGMDAVQDYQTGRAIRKQQQF